MRSPIWRKRASRFVYEVGKFVRAGARYHRASAARLERRPAAQAEPTQITSRSAARQMQASADLFIGHAVIRRGRTSTC